MQEGEFQHGLRDLLDLDALFAEYGRDAEFWPLLVARAAELGLGRPLYYAVQQLRALFGTAMPQDFLAAVAAFRPNILTRGVMGSLLGMALAGPSAAGTSRSTDLARWLLYVRGTLRAHAVVSAGSASCPQDRYASIRFAGETSSPGAGQSRWHRTQRQLRRTPSWHFSVQKSQTPPCPYAT